MQVLRAGLVIGALICTQAAAARAEPIENAKGARVVVMTFFDSGEADLSADARRSLDEAAKTIANRPSAHLIVGGHRDAAEAMAADDKLVARRIEAVISYLRAKGVRADKAARIDFAGNRPLIATARGVREPQNRRVDLIVLP